MKNAVQSLKEKAEEYRKAQIGAQKWAEQRESEAAAHRVKEAMYRRLADEMDQAISDLTSADRRRALYGGRDPVTG